MPARLHLVRHGEVHNPDRVLYGRMPGFHLSELGHRMAAESAASLDRKVERLYASPLQRAQESAEPWAARFGLETRTEHRIIEPRNEFEGKTFEAIQALWHPTTWRLVLNPFKPSWGEPYVSIAERMVAAMEDAWAEAEESGIEGDIVMVSHQLPIWTTHLSLAGQRLWHDPRKRRCALSSITSFELRGGIFTEVDYDDPAATDESVDLGAV